ncbi:uncharacterized protein RHOBADRAFT_56625 [Rhodotorula graminis WP1]|uniref:Integrase catalytic domain-containing protein n=1 Tax=Rhodotorula graminis (strain WP1) TaxID=578459 RepID=A0A0P9GVC4_RHOGW|nr:uncharacterized protein RHOBADRAFT_56625 [Rhodotorula graminis WP1]KPV71432.1 hypothetical protein RHOBADRAFT_56625 [Rhodotorula graminis WP1]
MSRPTPYSGRTRATAPRQGYDLPATLAAHSASSSLDTASSSPTCRGYGDEWAADGNDRLSSQHLGLGALSFGVFAIRDRFSGYIVALECVPDTCDADSLADVFLTAVELEQGVPSRLVIDNGPENDKMLQVQVTLHDRFRPTQTESSPPPYEVKTPNASLLNLWSQWMRNEGRMLQHTIQVDAGPAGFDPDDGLHLAAALFVWSQVIQAHLDAVRRIANMMRVRRQPNKVAGLISGHVPDMARRGWHGGERCIVPCSLDVVRGLRSSGVVGPTLGFVGAEFEVAAHWAHDEMGRPALRRVNAWDIWDELCERLS